MAPEAERFVVRPNFAQILFDDTGLKYSQVGITMKFNNFSSRTGRYLTAHSFSRWHILTRKMKSWNPKSWFAPIFSLNIAHIWGQNSTNCSFLKSYDCLIVKHHAGPHFNFSAVHALKLSQKFLSLMIFFDRTGLVASLGISILL